MKRVLILALLSLLICCGCAPEGKPKPIHLDGEGGLKALLPGQNQKDEEEDKSAVASSDILGNLIQDGSIRVPEVPGVNTQTLWEQYTALEERTAQALEDETVDRAEIRTEIAQLSGVVSLEAAAVKGQSSLTTAQKDSLKRYYAQLTEGLGTMLEDLKE